MSGFAVDGPGPREIGLPEQGGRGMGDPRPFRRRAIGAALLLLVPMMAFAARRANPETYPHVPLGGLRCPNGSVTLHLIDDRSGSTWSTDPMRRREQELTQLARWETDESCRLEVAASSFDNVTPPLPPVAAGTDVAEVGIADALPVDGPESSSTLTPVLLQSTEWARRSPDHHHVAVIATDGMIDLDDAFPAIRDFPGDIVIMALGGQLPDEWRDVRDHVDRVVVLAGQVGLGDVAIAAADAVRSIVQKNQPDPGASR